MAKRSSNTRRREWMEDPRKEVEELVRTLVCVPSLRAERGALYRCCMPEVHLDYLYVSSDGVEDLIALYHVGELLFNYRDVEFHKVLYDESQNAMALHMTVYARPWISLFRKTPLHFFTLLELQDCPQQDGKVLKRIRVQSDFVERSFILLSLPFIGTIYNSYTIRVILGRLTVSLIRALECAYSLLPQTIQNVVESCWTALITVKIK